jgi:hypothetical protein
MNLQNERRLVKVDVDGIIAEAQKKKAREEACTYHKDASGETKAWLLAVNFCHECGKQLREIE